jgi:23S rRNA (cytosine1962-C5)-methyltransferase
MDAQKGFAAAMRCAKTLPMAQENQRRRENARAPAADGAARLQLIETAGFPDYALLDSGGGRKLERFGPIVVDRPEPQALWTPAAPEREWRHAHAVFSGDDEEDKGRWRIDKPVPESWPVKVGAATVLCRLASFRHMGLFPEQMPHWEWMLARLAEKRAEPPRVLNLFAYTGAASLIAAAAGAHVTHVDASKKAIAWAKENQAVSGLEAAPVRWMLDDAAKFVAREVRRGKTYDVILVDPPKFGRGPDGEVWDLFTSLPPLMKDCAALLAPGAAMVLTVYAIRASSLAFDQLCREVLKGRGGSFQSGELAIRETGGDRAVPASLYTRWSAQ